jgi:hypothetical protein
LDQIEAYDEEDQNQYDNPRLRGYQDPRTSRKGSRSAYDGEEPPTSRNRNRPERYGEEPPRKRRPRPNTPPTSDRAQQWGDAWEETPPVTRPRKPRPDSQPPETSSRPPKRRPRPSDFESISNRDLEATSVDYVDYQPIDQENEDNQDINRNRNRNRDRDQEENQGQNRDDSLNFDY